MKFGAVVGVTLSIVGASFVLFTVIVFVSVACAPRESVTLNSILLLPKNRR